MWCFLYTLKVLCIILWKIFFFPCWCFSSSTVLSLPYLYRLNFLPLTSFVSLLNAQFFTCKVGIRVVVYGIAVRNESDKACKVLLRLWCRTIFDRNIFLKEKLIEKSKEILWLGSADDVAMSNCYKSQCWLSFLYLSHHKLVENSSLNVSRPLVLFWVTLM